MLYYNPRKWHFHKCILHIPDAHTINTSNTGIEVFESVCDDTLRTLLFASAVQQLVPNLLVCCNQGVYFQHSSEDSSEDVTTKSSVDVPAESLSSDRSESSVPMSSAKYSASASALRFPINWSQHSEEQNTTGL